MIHVLFEHQQITNSHETHNINLGSTECSRLCATKSDRMENLINGLMTQTSTRVLTKDR